MSADSSESRRDGARGNLKFKLSSGSNLSGGDAAPVGTGSQKRYRTQKL